MILPFGGLSVLRRRQHRHTDVQATREDVIHALSVPGGGAVHTEEGAARSQGGFTREAAVESHLQDEAGFERGGWGRVYLAKEVP